jgi:putative hydrolase of HD superfamily
MKTPAYISECPSELRRQLAFVLEIDRLKSVIRRSYLADESRHENSAEHSWHLALIVLVLHCYASEPIDLLKTLKLVLLHDVVEIDAGDAFVYDEEAQQKREQLESAAAVRIFGLLPSQQGEEFHLLWTEFEERQTPEARFAAAVDRLMPLLHNCFTGGRSWKEHKVTRDQVIAKNRIIADGSDALWNLAKALIEEVFPTEKC